MRHAKRRFVVFDLWQTLLFGGFDSALSIFYREITGEELQPEQLRQCLLIDASDPRLFLEKFLHAVTPSNRSSMLLSLLNPRSPLHGKLVERFQDAVRRDSRELRWAPGALDLLGSLGKRYSVAAASNLFAYQKDFLIKELEFGKIFDRCLFSCNLGMDKRRILEELPRLLHAQGDDILFIGRSYEHDILPAVGANLAALRIPDQDEVIDAPKIVRLVDEEFDGPSSTPTPRPSSASRALFVIPPFFRLLGSHNNRINLGASFASAYFDSKGVENAVWHCDAQDHERYITRYQMVFNSIEFFDRLGEHPAFREFEDYYRRSRADEVIVTCGDILNPSFDSGSWYSALRIARIVRKIHPRAFITAMGPEIGRGSGDFDLVVRGEVEKSLERILSRGCRGRLHGELLPEAEWWDFPSFDPKRLLNKIPPTSLDTVIWRRGCVGTCDFCRVAEINQGRVRLRSIPAVMHEVRMRRGLGLKNLYLVDANFTSERKAVEEFCRMFKAEFPGMTWRTESRFDTLNADILAILRDSGCTHLKLGLENTLDEKHHVRTKRVSIQAAREKIAMVKDAGLKCIIYLMLGGKWFTRSQYEQMLENAYSLKADGYTVSLHNPYPGTPGGISFEEWERWKFIGSHLDIRLIDFWRIPIDIFERFFELELKKGREDRNVRAFAD